MTLEPHAPAASHPELGCPCLLAEGRSLQARRGQSPVAEGFAQFFPANVGPRAISCAGPPCRESPRRSMRGRPPRRSRLLPSILSHSQISNFKFEIARGCALTSMFSRLHFSAKLCGSQRRSLPAAAGVIFFLAVPPASCNSQLQLDAFLRSIDYTGLTFNLTPFRINTSKLSEVLIMEDLCRT